jgi:tetratricopeptide (TPR) repeat protein
MFSFKNLSYISVKANASKSFIDTVQSIQDLKSSSKSKDIDDEKVLNSNKYLEKAKSLLNRCIETNNFAEERLKEISENLLSSIENNSNNAEAYLNIGNICYILGNVKLALKYLKMAQSINPKLEGISTLRDAISENKVIENKDKLLSSDSPKNVGITRKEESKQQQEVATKPALKPIVSSNVRSMYSISNKKF